MKTRFTAANDAGLLLGRLLMAALFLPSGIMKAMSFGNTVGLMNAVHAPMPELAAAVAIFCEIVLPVLIVIGFRTRAAALLLILYTAGATYLAHRFWLMPPAQVMEAQINFFKNVAVMGGFLILASAGPGRYSVDRD